VIQEATILLVEDDADDALLMRRAFSRARLANPLQIVQDGEEAIEYLEGTGKYSDRNRFPLPLMVLLDLKLPGKHGFEVLEWIRDQSHFDQLPVVILTASKEQPDIQKAYRLGANSYLVKPTGLEDLVEMMLRLQGYWILVNCKPERISLVIDE